MKNTAIIVLLVLACSCFGSTRPSRFYVLTPVAEETDGEASDLAVSVGPIALPRYLSTPEMVTRVGGSELLLAEYDRWGEPLQEGFERTLATNLARLLATDHVVRSMWEASLGVDRTVRARVSRFDVEDGWAVLEATWTVVREGEDPVRVRRSRFTREVAGDEPAAIARALSETLGDFSRTIAERIREEAP